jgi:hypothetical protein
VVGLAALHQGLRRDHHGEPVILGVDRIAVVGEVHTRSVDRVIRGVHHVVHSIDGHRIGGAGYQRDIIRAVGERPGYPRTAQEEPEDVVHAVHELQVFVRGEHEVELQRITGRDEVELQDRSIVHDLGVCEDLEVGIGLAEVATPQGTAANVIGAYGVHHISRGQHHPLADAQHRAGAIELTGLLGDHGGRHTVERNVAHRYALPQQDVLHQPGRGLGVGNDQLGVTYQRREQRYDQRSDGSIHGDPVRGLKIRTLRGHSEDSSRLALVA